MKAEKSSIYREIENLILWFIPIGNKIPKDFALPPDKVYIQYAKKGVKFIGSVVMPNRIYLSNRTVGRMYEMLNEMECFCRGLNLKNISIDESFRLEHYVCSCNSYMGFLKYNNSYALRRKLFGSLSYFWKVAYISGHFDKIVLRKRFNTSEVIMKLNGCKTIKKENIWKQSIHQKFPKR